MTIRRERMFAIAGLCVGACLVIAAILSVVFSQESATAGYGASAGTQKAVPPARLGPSGLPVPRFVSLKRDKVNVRKGPSTDHRVKWVYNSKGYPVEIIAESDNWRRIRDAQGDEGWVFHSLLSGSRTAIVSPWGDAVQIPLLSEPHAGSPVIASLSSGVMGVIDRCSGHWCRLAVPGFTGWVEQNRLWGVYPDENFN